MASGPSPMSQALVAATTNRGRVPPELTDYIVDYLHDDKYALAACAMVSRSWLHSSHHHLFQTIHIKLQGGGTTDKLEDFLVFLADTPNLCSFVECLIISGEKVSPGEEHSICTQHGLPSILRRLPNVHELSFRHLSTRHQCSPATLDLSLTPSLPKTFKLRRLVLDDVTHESIPFLLDFLGLFHEVVSLEMSDDIFPEPVTLSEIIIPSGTQIHELRINTGFVAMAVLYRAMKRSPSLRHSLHTIHATFQYESQIAVFGELVKQLPNLRELDMNSGTVFTDGRNRWLDIDLSSCHKLERLGLHLPYFPYTSEPVDTVGRDAPDSDFEAMAMEEADTWLASLFAILSRTPITLSNLTVAFHLKYIVLKETEDLFGSMYNAMYLGSSI